MLIGLGINHLGPTSAEALAKRFGSMGTLIGATAEEISAIDGIGPTIAESITRFFGEDSNRAVVAKLAKGGVALDMVEGADLPQVLSGLSIVVSGNLTGFSRNEATAAVKDRGGKSPGSVSKNTFALVAGPGAGASKLTKAESLGIPQVDEPAFLYLLEHGELPELPPA